MRPDQSLDIKSAVENFYENVLVLKVYFVHERKFDAYVGHESE